MGIFKLRHLRQHIVEPGEFLAVEGLCSELRAVLATKGLGIVRLLGLNAGLGHDVGEEFVGVCVIKGLVLTLFFDSQSISLSLGHLGQLEEVHLGALLLLLLGLPKYLH